MFKFFRKHRRKKIVAQPFPPQWLEIINRNIPFYEFLDQPQKDTLIDQVKVFIAEKQFEGAGGLEITDEIRVTIAAQACLLTVGLKNDCYPLLETVVVYPAAYKARVVRNRGGVPIESYETRLGESWTLGTVVLSWNDSLKGGINANDGHNVVLHEFAHQLDSESGDTQGSPVLKDRSSYATWSSVLGKEYERLAKALSRRQKTLIRRYGATNPAEFFAVITELFFERPKQLQKKHKDLYEELVKFYGQDPLEQRKKAN